MEVGSGHHFIPIYTLFLIICLRKTLLPQGFWRMVRISLLFLSFIRINRKWGHFEGIFRHFHIHMPPPPICNPNQEGNENHASL